MKTPASEFKLEGSDERVVGANGEVNASSKKELIWKQMQLMAAQANGSVVSDQQVSAESEASRFLTELAISDIEARSVIGSLLADQVYLTMNRNGFARRALARLDLIKGEPPRMRVRRAGATVVFAVLAQNDSHVSRDKWFTPPEMQLCVRPHVCRPDADGNGGQTMADTYLMSIEASMVVEDRMWIGLLKKAASLTGNSRLVQEFTPETFMEVVGAIKNFWTPHVFVSSDVWNKIAGKEEFLHLIDPVAKVELLLSGHVCTMLGRTVVTDAYRHPTHRVLSEGEFFAVADPLNHGYYSDRGGLMGMSTHVEHETRASWLLHENLSMALVDEQSVSFGQV